MHKRRTTAALTAVVATLVITAGTPGAGAQEAPRAKNIILLIGDGMGVTHVNAARLRFEGADGRLAMEQLEAQGSVSTYELEDPDETQTALREVPGVAPVPDSASTATSWSSGVKTYNNAIGQDVFGTDVVTIMEQASAAGMRTGNVSTAEITDATPAAMMSHVGRRACQGPTQASCDPDEANIADQIARNQTADVILGGGMRRFEPDDQAALEANGYRVLGDFGDDSRPPNQALQTAATQQVPTRRDLSRVYGRNQRVVGLFNRGNMTVEAFKQESNTAVEAQEPTLPEMTRAALRMLYNSDEGRANGFFLQVEGAHIDKRSHANDANQTLEEMRAFDDAVQTARNFAASPAGRDTLVIVTADHECAGFNIIGNGSFANAEAANPPGNVDSSNPANNSRPARTASSALDPERSTGPVNGSGSTNATNFAPAYFRMPDDPADVADGDPRGSLVLTYLSGNHTGADVPIYASGPGSERFDSSIDNTDIYFRMRDSLAALTP